MFNGKIRQRMQNRPLLSNRQMRFGQGQALTKVQERVETATAKIMTRKPNVLPMIEEKLSTLEIGSRVKEMVPQLAQKPTEKPVRKILRPTNIPGDDPGQSGAGDVSIIV